MHFMTTIGIILLVAYEIKKDSMTRAERRAYNVCWRNKRKQTHEKRNKNTDFGCN